MPEAAATDADTEYVSDVDRVVAEHPFTEKRRLFFTSFTCESCGFSQRAFNGVALPMARAFIKADHWAEYLHIPKWRTIEDIHAGR